MSHLVDRLELEVHAADEDLARLLLDRLSRLHHQALEGVLARVLDQLSPPGSLHRLERLELDLGEIPADQLDQQFPQRLEQALRRALPPRLQPDGERAPLQVDAPRAAPPREVPDTSTRPDTPKPASGGDMLDSAGHQPPSADSLPQVSPSRLPVEPSLETLPPHQAGAPASEAPPSLPVKATAVPLATAAAAGKALAETTASMTHKPPTPMPDASRQGGLELLAFFAATGTLPWWAPRHDARLIPATFNAALRLPPEQTAPFLGQLARAPAARHRLLIALDPAQRLLLGEALGADATLAPEGPTRPPERDRQQKTTAGAAPSDRDRKAPPVEPSAPRSASALNPDPGREPEPPSFPTATASVPQPPQARQPPQAPPALIQPAVRASTPPGPVPEEALPSPFRPGEEILVDGAGLVLLWPFLITLFDRLAWLTPERCFEGTAEQQRAMALLAFLVDGDPMPPEWRLPLAKLLCGAPLESLWGLEGDLSDAEREEAETLLQAVLAHAEGRLGEEIGALRGQWLQRPGLLTWRPRAWLLVVERRDDLDGALERLPWCWDWIRLPWMPELVQVAW